jgi:hypothetical protein
MSLIEGHWLATKDGDRAALDLFKRHYSAKKNPHRKVDQFIGPGEKHVYVTRDYKALFGWRKFIDASGQVGINCAVFRNEGEILSSELILEAEQLAWAIYPGARLYTYVDGHAVHGDGCCFKHAGWRKLKKRTKSGLIILEKLP